MNWKKRLRQWLLVLRLENKSVGKLPWLTMVMAVLSGPVPRRVWRERIRFGCARCPLYSTVQPKGTKKRTDLLHLCKSTHPLFAGLGCGCAVNIAAMTASPYAHGCFGRNLPIKPELGWGPHVWPHWWSRYFAIIDFIRGK